MMSLTTTLRRRLERDVALDDLLPDELPAYVHSYVYLFGIATIASLVLLILSGIWLAAAGPTWWHGSAQSLCHLWTVCRFWLGTPDVERACTAGLCDRSGSANDTLHRGRPALQTRRASSYAEDRTRGTPCCCDGGGGAR